MFTGGGRGHVYRWGEGTCIQVGGGDMHNMSVNADLNMCTHMQGFSSGLFPFWRDQNGVPRTSRDATFNLPPIVNG